MKYRPDNLYQDRTWFDELGERLMQQIMLRLPRADGRLWTTGFALFACVCVAWAAGLATHCVVFELSWNQSVAQLLAALMLLVAARHFLAATGLSAASTRAERKLIRRAQRRPVVIERRIEAPQAVAVNADVSAPQPSAPVQPKESPKAFFREVKAAGINVRIARALYSAGFHSAQQVRESSDAKLLAAPGVGKGTLRKLRLKFGLPKAPTQSNA